MKIIPIIAIVLALIAGYVADFIILLLQLPAKFLFNQPNLQYLPPPEK
jgi:hypothetical protein